jgi:hypothetical protein
MVNPDELRDLLIKTIGFLDALSPISPTLKHDAEILRHTMAKTFPGEQVPAGSVPSSANPSATTSFS